MRAHTTLWQIARLEWRILRRERSVVAVLALFAILLVIAAWTGGREAAHLRAAQERSRAEFNARMAAHHHVVETLDTTAPLQAEDPRDPVWMGQVGAETIAILPPAPLAPIALGQRALLPQSVRVSTSVHLTAARETDSPMSGPTRLATGTFDPSFLFVVLLPLVVIALSYELLAGERERGTLAMLLSQPITQRSLVLGKALARAVLVSLVTLLSGLIGLWLAGADLSAPSAWLHVLWYALLLVAWAFIWFTAAVAVNSRGGNSASNALALIGIWLVVVVVIPGLSAVAVDSVYPAPSAIELISEAREAAQEIESELNDVTGRHDDTNKRADYGERVVAIQNRLAARSAPVLDELRERRSERRHFMERLQYISPAIVVARALEDIAGADAARHAEFEAQVEAYHKTLRAFFSERIVRRAKLTADDLDQLPTMTFKNAPESALAGRMAIRLLLLTSLALLLLGLARPGLSSIGRLTR